MSRASGKGRVRLFVLLALFVAAVLAAVLGLNGPVGVTEITVRLKDLPPSFDGFKILQVTDLHSKWFGEGQRELLRLVDAEAPDIMLWTGDMVDRFSRDRQPALALAEGVSIPVYSVTGNHEGLSHGEEGRQNARDIVASFRAAGVTCLENESAKIFRGNESILLYGIADFATDGNRFYHEDYLPNVAPPPFSPDECVLLLYHRATEADELAGLNADLILSGHVHGGIVRLPFVGGLLSPEKTLFPKYDAGLYTLSGGTQLVVGRGLANSGNFPRMFNPPELVLITLRKENG